MASKVSEATGPLAAALAHARRLLQGSPAAAAEQAREILRVVPDQLDALSLLATALRLADDDAGADGAVARHIRASVRDPRLREAATALCDNRLALAEALLRAHLKGKPTDVAAIRMLAEVGARLGRYGDAEALLARCLELAPGFAAARHNYAVVLHRQSKSAAALAEVDRLLGEEPTNPNYRNLHAAVLARLGDYERAIAVYADVLAAYPQQPKGWMSYGHALKTVGRQADSIAAYRRSIELLPSFGEAYWSLANLKTFRFTDGDIAAMRAQLARDLGDEDRFHFSFALGKALEDAGDPGGAFEAYAQGNAIRRAGIDYDADENAAHVRRSKALFTGAFFAARAGGGDPASDPIFIIGLPRSGSTLVEQILASHSQVEGTQELPDIGAIANRLGGRRARDQASRYPDVLAELSAGELRALGAEYLEHTRIQRKTGRPFFIDKMPNNFAHVGLIRLILPHSKIIDARRHPLGCCFSGFKQHFARGQAFTYDLAELGRYYADYVELMAHFDVVLPGSVHRVFYEDMVADTEAEVRRLLDHCGLPFEDSCLRFYENDRAVRTASSEQVRRPIFREGTDHWRLFEPWLDPLKAALGPVLHCYPTVPLFDRSPVETDSERT